MTRTLIAVLTVAALLAPGLAQAQTHQPRMYAALHDLQAALAELHAVDSHEDHGGYAGRATVEVQHAIDNVRDGIAYRNSHP